MHPTVEKFNLPGIWTMLAGTVIAVVYMFTTFVTVADFNELSVEVYYSQFYDTIDRLKEAENAGENEYSLELERRLERLKAKICAIEPDWERCDKPA
jgi:hypothetical protein